VSHAPEYTPGELGELPASIKDRLLLLMSKRGLITDTNITELLHDKVRTLDLSFCDVSDDSLQIISTKCPALRKIDLNSNKISRTDITSQGVVCLGERCRQLQVVYLRRCLHITDEAIVKLSQGCLALRDLNIGGCPRITDHALTQLGQNSRHLRSINFSGANVTDEGVIRLVQGAAGQQLKEIHMARCRELTDEAVEAVTQYCPNINILLLHECPKITDQSRVAVEELQSKMKQVTWTIY